MPPTYEDDAREKVQAWILCVHNQGEKLVADHVPTNNPVSLPTAPHRNSSFLLIKAQKQTGFILKQDVAAVSHDITVL